MVHGYTSTPYALPKSGYILNPKLLKHASKDDRQMAEDYRTWPIEELLAEIQREEESLADLRQTLKDIEDTIASVQEQIETEELPLARERYLRRQRTITQLQKRIPERAEDIKRREERIAERAKDVIRVEIFFPQYPSTIRGIRRSVSALRGWQTRRRRQQERDERRLKRLQELQVKEEPFIPRYTKLREELDYWREQRREIRRDIAEEEARLDKKKAVLPLYRVKVRLYNEIEGPEGSPTGMFQAWFDIDAILNPKTRLVRWDWWLTALELRQAQTHMIGYFKAMAKWITPDEIGQATLDETLGIPYGSERVTYARKKDGTTFTKGLPREYIAEAEQMTVEELVVGESSVKPKPNPRPMAQNMGVFFEKVMIIGVDGQIKWQEIRDRWIWHPTDDQVKKVMEELKIGD